MRRRAAAALSALLALAGCGIQESDVVEAGGAATVIVVPVPDYRAVLYFLGPDGRSMPVAREIRASGEVAVHPARKGIGWNPSAWTGEEDENAAGGQGTPRVATAALLAALLAGPLPSEAEQGVTTALPDGSRGHPRVVQDPVGATAARRLLRVEAPFPVMELSEAAVRQLVCTTAYAEHPAGLVDVTLAGPDGALPTGTCDD